MTFLFVILFYFLFFICLLGARQAVAAGGQRLDVHREGRQVA